MASSGVAKWGATSAAAGTTTGAAGAGLAVADGAGSETLAAADGVADSTGATAEADDAGAVVAVDAATDDAAAAGFTGTALLAAGEFELAQPASARLARVPAMAIPAAFAKSRRGLRICVRVIGFPVIRVPSSARIAG